MWGPQPLSWHSLAFQVILLGLVYLLSITNPNFHCPLIWLVVISRDERTPCFNWSWQPTLEWGALVKEGLDVEIKIKCLCVLYLENVIHIEGWKKFVFSQSLFQSITFSCNLHSYQSHPANAFVAFLIQFLDRIIEDDEGASSLWFLCYLEEQRKHKRNIEKKKITCIGGIKGSLNFLWDIKKMKNWHAGFCLKNKQMKNISGYCNDIFQKYSPWSCKYLIFLYPSDWNTKTHCYCCCCYLFLLIILPCLSIISKYVILRRSMSTWNLTQIYEFKAW